MIRTMIFPVSKSAPLAICAFMILSVSSIKIGINLSAIDIIMAISCTGSIKLKGFIKRSSALVSWFGVVVSVIREVPTIRKLRRIAIRTAISRPFSVMVIFQNVTSTSSPGVKIRLNTTVIPRRKAMDFIPFRIKERGTLDTLIQAARNRNAARYPIQSFVTNRLTI